MTDGTGSIDWGFAELLSFASLSDEGFSIRLSGQDSQGEPSVVAMVS